MTTRFRKTCVALAVCFAGASASAMNLLEAYQLALDQDATIRASRAALAVGQERVPPAWSPLVPSVQAHLGRTRNDLDPTAPNFFVSFPLLFVAMGPVSPLGRNCGNKHDGLYASVWFTSSFRSTWWRRNWFGNLVALVRASRTHASFRHRHLYGNSLLARPQRRRNLWTSVSEGAHND